jgi:hypothetical protein
MAVMRVTSEVNMRDLDDLVTFSVFLRADIYEFLKTNGLDDASKYRRREIHLRWNDANLTALLDRRVALAGVDGIADLGSVFTEEKIGGRRLADYMLGACAPRPRDVLQFFAECLESCIFRGGTKVSRDDVRSAEAAYSAWRRDVILEESRTGYDYLGSVLESFNARPPTYLPGQLTTHLAQAKLDYDIPATKPKLIDTLVEFGVLGVRSGRNTRYIWDVPAGQQLRPESAKNDADSDCWVIHRSLHRVLGLK